MRISTSIRRHVLLLAAALAVSLAMVCGCRDSQPARVIVRGRVTYNGKPAKTRTVCFVRTGARGDEAINRPAVGELAPDGTYSMRTFGKDDGVLPGEYVATITAVDDGRAVDVNWEGKPLSQEQIRSQLLLPLKYSTAETSGLKASVPANAG